MSPPEPQTAPLQAAPPQAAPNNFLCACPDHLRVACKDEGFYKEFEGEPYCVLHYPGEKDGNLFLAAVKRKLGAIDYQFQGVVFPAETTFAGETFKQQAFFNEAHFDGKISFIGTRFEQGAHFDQTGFNGEVLFNGVTFDGAVAFSRAAFKNEAVLNGSEFKSEADFSQAQFGASAKFNGTQFGQDAHFNQTEFNGEAHFNGLEFAGNVEFSQAEFKAEVNFRGSLFKGTLDFTRVEFGGAASFDEVQVDGAATFNQASFAAGADFSRVKFNEDAHFFRASLGGEVSLRLAEFVGEADFAGARFSDADKTADFSDAQFFDRATFRQTRFDGRADFSKQEFSREVDFRQVRFDGDVEFSKRQFLSRADFQKAVFGRVVNFVEARFAGEANFEEATFKDYARFAGAEGLQIFAPEASLNLQFVHCEKPERVSFHTLGLRPHWFVNVDPRKFEFIKVEWDLHDSPPGRPAAVWRARMLQWLEKKDRLDREWEALLLVPGHDRQRHRLLSIACRQLAVNAEENHRYSEASLFRYESMEIRRWEHSYKDQQRKCLRHLVGESVGDKWVNFLRPRILAGLAGKCWREFRNWRWRAVWSLDWWYWLVSDFGESIGKGFVVFILLLMLFAACYTRTDFDRAGNSRLDWREAVVYSLSVSLLQRPEPKPLGAGGKMLVLIETALGPAQAALLALAVRRKFMR